MSYSQKEPIGIEQIAVSSTAVGPTTSKDTPTAAGSPPAANYAMFRNTGSGDVHWRDDGTDPAATGPFLLKAGEIFNYDADPRNIKFIRVTVDTTIDAAYYRED